MGFCVCTFLLVILFVRVLVQQPTCQLRAWKQKSYFQEGDVILGGFFIVHSESTSPEITYTQAPQPISCEGFHIRYYRDVLAMVFAITEINRTPDLLPNITLGFQIFDSCMSQIKATGGVLEFLSGTREPVPGYQCYSHSIPFGAIGELMSSISVPLARIFGLFHFPQISYGSVLSTLSDKLQFPSFLRTVPSSTFQNIALARLMQHFGWTWIGMIISDDDLGLLGGQDIKSQIEAHVGCVAFMEKVHLSYSREKILQIVERSQRQAVKVIIVHSPEVHIKALMEMLYFHNVTDKVLVFSASFTLTLGLFMKQTWKLFNGSLGLSPHATPMPNLENFLTQLNPARESNDIFISLLWEKVFDCEWQGSNGTDIMATKGKRKLQCSEKMTLDRKDIRVFELYDLSYTYHTYLGVYALAHALSSLMSCKDGHGPFAGGSCADVNNIQPWQVLHYVKKSNIIIPNGDKIFFDANGDAPRAYDILNVQIFDNDDIRLVNVGSFDPKEGVGIHVNESNILWTENSQVPRSVCSERCLPGYRKASREGQPVCCFQCVPCSHGEITDSDANECMKCPNDQWPNMEQDRCIQKATEFLSFENPLGLTLTFSATFLSFIAAAVLGIFIKYRDTPIVKANNRGLSYLLLSALISFFFSSVIFIGRPTVLTCLLRQTVFGIVFTISVSSVLAKTVIVVIAFKATNPSSSARRWLGPKTPSCIVCLCTIIQVLICTVWIVKSPPFPELNMNAFNEKIIVECNEGQQLFFYCMLGYMGLLATVSFIVAFLSRNLPGSFNEAKLITFSMLVFVSVWISFIPAYLSTRGKYMVAVEVFAILCSGAGLLGCIFFPKCYIILVRPDMNCRLYIAGKT